MKIIKNISLYITIMAKNLVILIISISSNFSFFNWSAPLPSPKLKSNSISLCLNNNSYMTGRLWNFRVISWIYTQLLFNIVLNWVVFLGCGCKEFSEACNKSYTGSMGFKSSKYRLNGISESQPIGSNFMLPVSIKESKWLPAWSEDLTVVKKICFTSGSYEPIEHTQDCCRATINLHTTLCWRYTVTSTHKFDHLLKRARNITHLTQCQTSNLL